MSTLGYSEYIPGTCDSILIMKIEEDIKAMEVRIYLIFLDKNCSTCTF